MARPPHVGNGAATAMNSYEIDPGNLVTAGYRHTQLKDPVNPFAAENRRVQVINAADK